MLAPLSVLSENRHSDMEFHTASSRTTGRTSIPMSSELFALLKALESTMLRSLTRSRTDKQKEPMA